MKEYDLVLCRFKDAFDICDDDTIRLWLMIKIAECFAPTDIDTAQNIISSAIQQNNAELNEYINKHQNEKDPIIKDMIGKVEFYQSVFPPGIEQRQEELAAKIAKTLFN
jgi:23S rRNA A1618 N6-methylase RlmF